MFEVDGKNYELRYNLKRLQALENALGQSLMDLLIKTSGALKINDMVTVFAHGLAGEDGIYCPIKKGKEEAEKIMEAEGYQKMLMEVVTTLQDNCPFLFQAD